MSCCECDACCAGAQASAIILDLDGTILNTEQVTKDVLKEFLAKYGKLVDEKKENSRLGKTHEESAIAIVKEYDLPIAPHQFTEDIMPMYRQKWSQAKALPGANRLIRHLHKHGVPFALASNSVRKNTDAKISHQQGWKECFSVILGSNQVKSGKPSPDLFLEAANEMGVDAVCCLVIEDSLVGVQAAKAAGMKVVAVPSLQNETGQYSHADSVLHSLLEFQPELWGFPPFEDWVDDALPIEPIILRGLISDGLFCELTDGGLSALPDQLFGAYFGWARVDKHKIFKVVVGIGWKCCSSTFERKIQVCLIDGSNGYQCNQQIQIQIVGYIRELSSKGNTSVNVEMLEEVKPIASAALDLPMFLIHEFVTFFSKVPAGDSASPHENDQELDVF